MGMSDFSTSTDTSPSLARLLEAARRVLTTEAQAIEALVERLGESF